MEKEKKTQEALQQEKEPKLDKSKKVKKPVIQAKRLKTPTKVFLILIWTIAIVALAFCAYGVVSFFTTSSKPDTLLADFISENPKLIFKRLNFYKYLVRGTPASDASKSAKLTVFHAQGTADFAFDMTKLSIDSFDNATHTINFTFNEETYFPVEIIVNFDSLTEVDNVESESKTATSHLAGFTLAGNAASLYTSGVTSQAALKDVYTLLSNEEKQTSGQNKDDENFLNELGQSLSDSVTSILQSAGFITTLSSRNSIGEREELIDSAKILIAMELMASDSDTASGLRDTISGLSDSATLTDTGTWSDATREYYRSELFKAIRAFFQSFGWQNITITYKGEEKL